MQIIDWNTLDPPARRAALARPTQELHGETLAVVRDIIAAVRRDGDAALRDYTERFDGVRLDSFAASDAEFTAARAKLTPAQHAALEQAIDNVQRFHSAQLPQPLALDTMPGVRCERIIRPLSSVGLYVPAGSAPLPSTAIMLGVPARIAGCPRRLLCTPPDPHGRAHPAVLVAARLCGIETVFKIGGAQAIAALAYGTASIPRTDKIFGPGNAWVTAAKQLVCSDPSGPARDLPAGPSEVLVIADERARADFVAADLLAQAEHDAQAQAICVTSSPQLAAAVLSEIRDQTAALSRRAILQRSLSTSRCIVVPDIDTAIGIANEYAPEHLILQISEPRRWLPRIRHAGCIFLGAWSAEPMGDYCSGTNHVLPTYGHARAYSGLSVLDFTKSISVQELSPAGLSALGPCAIELATLEGLDAHANAVSRRLHALAMSGQRDASTSANALARTRAWGES